MKIDTLTGRPIVLADDRCVTAMVEWLREGNGEQSASIYGVATAIHADERRARHAVSQMVEHGYITVDKRWGNSLKRKYRLLPDLFVRAKA